MKCVFAVPPLLLSIHPGWETFNKIPLEYWFSKDRQHFPTALSAMMLIDCTNGIQNMGVRFKNINCVQDANINE